MSARKRALKSPFSRILARLVQYDRSRRLVAERSAGFFHWPKERWPTVNMSKPLRYIRRLGVELSAAMTYRNGEYYFQRRIFIYSGRIIILDTGYSVLSLYCRLIYLVRLLSTPLDIGLLSSSSQSTNYRPIVSKVFISTLEITSVPVGGSPHGGRPNNVVCSRIASFNVGGIFVSAGDRLMAQRDSPLVESPREIFN